MPDNVHTFPGTRPVHPDDIHSIFNRTIKIGDQFQATDWIIDHCIPEGVGIIAGTPGVGKTSALVPLALAIAGIKADACDLEVELPRKIIYITEDDAQVMLLLNGMRKFLAWDDVTWSKAKDRFRVVGSRRVNELQLSDIMLEAQADFTTHRDIEAPPLIVFDTISSNFDIQNESDNSMVSSYMAVLKQAYSRWKISSWLIGHIAKSTEFKTVDELSAMTTRGASAFTGDGQWTAILGATEKDNGGPRVMKLQKRRVTDRFSEIIFEGSIQQAQATNRFGEIVDIEYRYTVARKSYQSSRKAEAAHKAATELEQLVLDAIATMDYPSARSVSAEIKKGYNPTLDCINLLKLKGYLIDTELPKNMRHGAKKTYLAVAAHGDAF